MTPSTSSQVRYSGPRLEGLAERNGVVVEETKHQQEINIRITPARLGALCRGGQEPCN